MSLFFKIISLEFRLNPGMGNVLGIESVEWLPELDKTAHSRGLNGLEYTVRINKTHRFSSRWRTCGEGSDTLMSSAENKEDIWLWLKCNGAVFRVPFSSFHILQAV
jgi:hypothetical protein